MLQTMYKAPQRLLGLFEISKTKELFYDNEHICDYVLKCEKGFGHTVGVALRRTILSSTKGLAPVALKINDVQHLFSSVPGIKSSFLEISLQLQKVAFKFLDESIDYCFLSLKKKAGSSGDIVYASDFEKGKNVAIMNGGLPICTLDNGGELNMQVILASGIGYIAAQDHAFFPPLGEGFISVDSFFAPGTHCGYSVEYNTAGKNSFDCVTLTVKTNGAISPDEVLKSTGDKLFNLFKAFGDQEIKTSGEKSATTNEMDAILSSKIEFYEEELSQRSRRCLIENNMLTIEDLLPRTEVELRSLKGFGDKSLNEVKDLLTTLGLQLGKIVNKKRKI